MDHERRECQDPAFTAVVGVHDNADVFDRYNERDRPKNKRQEP